MASETLDQLYTVTFTGVDGYPRTTPPFMAMKAALNHARQFANWSIVRVSDDTVIAQSKVAPATEPEPTPERMVTNFVSDDSEPTAQDEIELQVLEDGHRWVQYGANYGLPRSDYDRMVALANNPAKMIQRRNKTWRIVAYADYKDYIAGDYTVLAQSEASEPCEHNFNMRENGDEYVECTICGATEPVDPQTQTGVQWLTFRDLPMLTYAKYFNQRMEISYGFKFQQRFADVDINGYKVPTSPVNAPNFNLAAKKVSLPNMQRRTVKTQTTRKQAPTQRETVMQIVSRLQTPLTGQVRRVA